jgi:hypothetical protein
MKAKTIDILNDPRLLEARASQFVRLGALYAGERLEDVFYLNGYNGVGQADPYAEPERWVEEALDDLAENASRLLDARTFRPLVIEFGPYGVHFIDRMFGADVFDLDGARNWQVHYLDAPVGQLQPPDLERDETWALARRAALASLGAGVSVPLFGLPTIASVLNIAVNLYGQRILAALLDEPEAARHDLGVISDLLCTLHRWYLERLPLEQLQPVVGGTRTQPPGYGQLCGCTTQLVSASQYRAFIAPPDDQLLSVYPHGGMIHLCGRHTQHIPAWREMTSLRAVQMNDRAVDDLAIYYRQLREDQILYANPYDKMPVQRILRITGGRRTVVVSDAPA